MDDLEVPPFPESPINYVFNLVYVWWMTAAWTPSIALIFRRFWCDGIIHFSLKRWRIYFHSYGHLLVTTGYKWAYTFYKWGYKYL